MAGNGTSGYLDGPLFLAQFNSPQDICDDGFGNVYVADSNNYRIRLININANQGMFLLFLFSLFLEDSLLKDQIVVSTFAGNGTQGVLDGPALNAMIFDPVALSCHSSITIFFKDLYSVFVGPLGVFIYVYLRKIQNGEFKPILSFYIFHYFNYFYYLSGNVTTVSSFIDNSLMSMDSQQNLYISTTNINTLTKEINSYTKNGEILIPII